MAECLNKAFAHRRLFCHFAWELQQKIGDLGVHAGQSLWFCGAWFAVLGLRGLGDSALGLLLDGQCQCGN